MLQYPQLLHIIALSFLAAATISDLKKREVPNWVNYGLIALGAGLALLQSVVFSGWQFLAFGLAGIGVALAGAAAMFYTGQWGGGDSKLLVGMGAILGMPVSAGWPFFAAGSAFVSFLSNLLVVSLFYAIIMAAFFAARSRKKVAAAFLKQLQSRKPMMLATLAFALVSIVIALFVANAMIRLAFAALPIALTGSLLLSILAKSVEQACMLKKVTPLKLTEGDWIAKDVVVGGKRICGPKDLGIEKRQISQLIALYKKRKISSVLIKEGIPFAPTFLIAYLATIFFGNVFLAVLQ